MIKHQLQDKCPVRFDVISIDGKSGSITWLKDAFGADANKVDQYVAQHKGDLNAGYFRDLVDYLNK